MIKVSYLYDYSLKLCNYNLFEANSFTSSGEETKSSFDNLNSNADIKDGDNIRP